MENESINILIKETKSPITMKYELELMPQNQWTEVPEEDIVEPIPFKLQAAIVENMDDYNETELKNIEKNNFYSDLLPAIN